MSIEVFVKYKGNQEVAISKLKEHIFSYKDKYNDLTLKYGDKWIWAYITENENYTYFTFEFSKDFTMKEREKFTKILIDLDFEINEDG